MTAPPDPLAEIVDAVLARLREAAPAIGLDAEAVEDSPPDPRDRADPPCVQVFAGPETEDFGVNGYPRADTAEGSVVIVLYVAARRDWRRRAMELRARARAALLGDAAFVREVGPVVRCEGDLAYDAEGQVIVGAATLTLTFRYQTDYPPSLPDAFAGGRGETRPAGAGDGTAPVPFGFDIPDQGDPT